MFRYLGKSFLLIAASVVIMCGAYPLILWVIGQTLFLFQVNGSIVRDNDGKVIGSLLVAQPFTKDEYFQPRPSAASFDATASTSSGYAPSNYTLRDRVARVIGPVATYADGPTKGKNVAPDVEAWFKADKAGGNPHIVGQWADAHNSLAQGWVTGEPTTGPMSTPGRKVMTPTSRIGSRPIRQRLTEAADLAVAFFKSFSNEHPGMFPSSATKTGADGKPVTDIEPVSEGSDIQSMFFDMWRADHPDVALNDLPGDLVDGLRLGSRPAHHLRQRRVPARSRRGQMGRRQEARRRRGAQGDRSHPRRQGIRALGWFDRRKNRQRARGQPRTAQAIRRTGMMSSRRRWSRSAGGLGRAQNGDAPHASQPPFLVSRAR